MKLDGDNTLKYFFNIEDIDNLTGSTHNTHTHTGEQHKETPDSEEEEDISFEEVERAAKLMKNGK